MGRPKGSKNKNSVLASKLEEILDITKKDAYAAGQGIKRCCDECGGILFGGQIIHQKDCPERK